MSLMCLTPSHSLVSFDLDTSDSESLTCFCVNLLAERVLDRDLDVSEPMSFSYFLLGLLDHDLEMSESESVSGRCIFFLSLWVFILSLCLTMCGQPSDEDASLSGSLRRISGDCECTEWAGLSLLFDL